MNTRLFAILLLMQLGWAVTIDATGGDCSQIGNWDAATMTCTLTADYTGSITVLADGITLDGAGYTLQAAQSTDYGISGDKVSGLTVRNFVMRGFERGISLNTPSNVLVENNEIHGGTFAMLIGNGIYAFTNATIAGNRIYNSSVGINLNVGKNAVVHDNYVTGSAIRALFLGAVSTGEVYRNTFEKSGRGLILYNSNGVTVYNNNFVDNTVVQAAVSGGSGNTFTLPAPTGGNYWSDLNCTDADGDGFCDSAYSIYGGATDELPWSVRDGWLPPESPGSGTGGGTPSLEEFNFSAFIVKVHAKLEDSSERKFKKHRDDRDSRKEKHRERDRERKSERRYDDRLSIRGWFVLSGESDGIDPASENVTIELGDYSFTVPAGSFRLEEDDECREYKYKERTETARVKFKVELCDDRNKFKFDVRGEEFGWLRDINSTSVRFEIGNDFGEKEVRPVVSRHKRIVLLASDLFEGFGLAGLLAALFAKGP